MPRVLRLSARSVTAEFYWSLLYVCQVYGGCVETLNRGDIIVRQDLHQSPYVPGGFGA
jgi:hypothetical protein